MTTNPLEPDPEFGEERIAAADPGQGAPEPAPGFGPRGQSEDEDGPEEDDREDS